MPFELSCFKLLEVLCCFIATSLLLSAILNTIDVPGQRAPFRDFLSIRVTLDTGNTLARVAHRRVDSRACAHGQVSMNNRAVNENLHLVKVSMKIFILSDRTVTTLHERKAETESFPRIETNQTLPTGLQVLTETLSLSTLLRSPKSCRRANCRLRDRKDECKLLTIRPS